MRDPQTGNFAPKRVDLLFQEFAVANSTTEHLVPGPIESHLEARKIRGAIGVVLPVHELQRFDHLLKTTDLVDDRLLHFKVDLNVMGIARRLMLEHLEVSAEALPLVEKSIPKPTEDSYPIFDFGLSKCC